MKYKVCGQISGSTYIGEFDANSKEEAEDLAIASYEGVSLCHQCAGEIEYPELTDAFAEIIPTEEE